MAILEIASQRVQTGSCPLLEGPVKTELEKEKEKCEAASFHEVFGQGSGNGMGLKYGREHFNSGIAGGMGIFGQSIGNQCLVRNSSCARPGDRYRCCSGY